MKVLLVCADAAQRPRLVDSLLATGDIARHDLEPVDSLDTALDALRSRPGDIAVLFEPAAGNVGRIDPKPLREAAPRCALVVLADLAQAPQALDPSIHDLLLLRHLNP